MIKLVLIIQAHIAAAFGVSVDDLIGRSNRSNIATARHYAMYLCCEHTALSHKQIAKLFRKTRPAVSRAKKVMRDLLDVYPGERAQMELFQMELGLLIESRATRPEMRAAA